MDKEKLSGRKETEKGCEPWEFHAHEFGDKSKRCRHIIDPATGKVTRVPLKPGERLPGMTKDEM